MFSENQATPKQHPQNFELCQPLSLEEGCLYKMKSVTKETQIRRNSYSFEKIGK